MKGVLIGSDFLNLEDGLKFLEINTDVDLFNTDVPHLKLDELFSYLTENNYTKLVLIYKTKHIVVSVVNAFQNKANENNIILETIVVPNNSITIPSIVDEANTFYLRCAYDVTAIIDDTYCRDKSEMVGLLFDSNNQEIMPKTYVVNQNNDTTYDNLNSLPDNGIHPNLIVKKIVPDFEKTNLPAFYKLSTAEELNSLKSNLNEITLLQEYQFNTSSLEVNDNRITDVVRTWHVLLQDVETLIDLGGHVSSNNLPLDFGVIEYDSTGKLDTMWRNMYFSNPRFLKNGVPDTYEVIKIVDNQEVAIPISEIVTGDTIKSITLSGLSFDTLESETNLWNSNGSLTDTITYSTASVVSIRNANWQGWFSNIGYNIDGQGYNSLIAQTEPILVRDASDNLIRFKHARDITISDSIITATSYEADVLSNEYSWYTGSLISLDIEPSDVFIGGTEVNDINMGSTSAFIVHNKYCTWCCFAEDTMISSEFGPVEIKNIKIGDMVWSYNFNTNEAELKEVEQIVSPMHDNIVHIELSNGKNLVLTTDHPLYSENGSLVSYQPEATKQWFDGHVDGLDVGTKLLTIDGVTEVVSILGSIDNIQTYTLFIKDNKNFYANGVLAFDEQKNK